MVKAATEHWTECGVQGLGVTGVRDQLKWNIFCNLPEGVVSATVDGVTGECIPSSAPPARVPPTATPERRKNSSPKGCYANAASAAAIVRSISSSV